MATEGGGGGSLRSQRIEFLNTAAKEYVEVRNKELDKVTEFGAKILKGRAGSNGLSSFSLDLSLDAVVKGVEDFVKGAIPTI